MTRVDNRSISEVGETAAFVIATDSAMSGWGEAPGRSIVARPIKRKLYVSIDSNGNTRSHYEVNLEELKRVESVFDSRREFKRVRVVYGKVYKPRMDDGDHLHIYGFDTFK